MKKYYVAAFKTNYNSLINSANVVGSCLMSNDGKHVESNCFDDFIIDIYNTLESDKNGKILIYFPGLKFDGTFILNHLLNLYGTQVEKEQHISTIISKSKTFYSIRWTVMGKVIECRDCSKKIPIKLEEYDRAFGLNIKASGNELIDTCERMRLALNHLYSEGHTSMTLGNDCFKFYKKMVGGDKKFRKIYPLLNKTEDAFTRQAYRGGYCYLNPEYFGKDVRGKVFDINSLYPSILKNYRLPYGYGTYKPGKPNGSGLWVARVSMSFYLKPGKLPTIPDSTFFNSEYMANSRGEMITMYITNYDWETIKEHYIIDEIRWIGHYSYNSFKNESLCQYVDHFNTLKTEATKTGNAGQRTISKLFMNNLIGKFGTRPEREVSIPLNCSRFGLTYLEGVKNETEPIYIPLPVFVNSIGRMIIIKDAQKAYDSKKFIYCDTDSIHVLEGFDASCIKCDPVELGCYKLEEEFTKGRYIKLKTYAHEVNGKLKVKTAGTDIQGQLENIDDFSGELVINDKKQAGCRGGAYIKNIKRRLCI